MTAPLLGAGLVAALAGCGGGSAAAPVPTATAAPSRTASASPAVSTVGGAAATATASVTTMTSFHSPTGNISCYLAPVAGGSPYARCDLAQASWRTPTPPGGCAADWGGGAGRGSVGVGAGPAQVLCVTDTVVDPGGRELPYGAAIALGPVVCTSRESGMTCEDTAHGHAFTASRQTVDLS